MILFTVGGVWSTIAALCCFENKLTPKRIINFLLDVKKFVFHFDFLSLRIGNSHFRLIIMQRNAAIEFSTIPMIFAQAIFIYGGNEELGWRGVMQSVLQKKLPYPIATLIVGVVWSMWHIPLWFIEGNSHQGSSFIAFALLAILLSFWLSAIINSHGSIFWCMILHGATNTLLSIFVIKMNWVLIIGLVLLTTLSLIISLVQLKKTQDKV
jgi:membrane protease YdiL (CAAX protease family)